MTLQELLQIAQTGIALLIIPVFRYIVRLEVRLTRIEHTLELMPKRKTDE